MKKYTGLLVWTLACILMGSLTGVATGHDRQYRGADITMSTSSSDLIAVKSPETVSVEAASSSLFMLTGSGGEMLVGLPETKPLGWSQGKYIYLNTTQIHSGNWEVVEGSMLTLHFTAEEDINVVRSLKPSSMILLVLGMLVITVLLWLIGILIGSTDH